MATITYTYLIKCIIFFFSRILNLHYKTPRYLHRQFINNALNTNNTTIHTAHNTNSLFEHSSNSSNNNDDSPQTLIFNVEDTLLLNSSSLFPYFMLVAFEGGSPIRALVLLILYPIICLFKKQTRVRIMVMVCFFGIKQDGFMVGKAILPKFFLEDVGLQGFEVVNKFKKKVCVSEMPNFMIESFLRDYLEIEHVFGRKLKVYCGYFNGLMEDVEDDNHGVKDLLGNGSDDIVGISGRSKASLNHPLFSLCKEIYVTSEATKNKWQQLPRENYPKPVIFHDGRLSLKPTPTTTLALFIWLPFAFFLAILRTLIVLTLPMKVAVPLAAFSSLNLLSTKSTAPKSKGQLYVCNHRTLLDPLYLSFTLMKPLTAVTYSLSKMSEFLSPIKTIRLRRDRDQDRQMMQSVLTNQGDLVVCPEGTTCREPFLLRFSPLFAEISEEIVPVAIDAHVTMFYGTTAGGFKFLDPLFFLMNPRPIYTVQLLEPVLGVSGQGQSQAQDQDLSRFGIDVANDVQGMIGEALGFKCTKLTRKDKYLILAGNQGIV